MKSVLPLMSPGKFSVQVEGGRLKVVMPGSEEETIYRDEFFPDAEFWILFVIKLELKGAVQGSLR